MENKFLFSREFQELDLEINICDIGASGGIGEPWSLLEDDIVKIIGFEPDLQQYDLLKNKYPKNKYYNIGLWSDKTIKDYYLTQQDYFGDFAFGTSSMYPPNVSELSLNYGSIDKGRVSHKLIEVECDRMDSLIIDKEDIPDFIKIDTQGSEYEILKGAENILRNNAPIITTEVWTEEIYKDAPLAHEIMSLLNQYGYRLFKTELAASRTYSIGESIHCQARHCGLELFYVKDYKKMSFISEDKLIKHIAIVEMFGFRDYAIFLLDRLGVITDEKSKLIKEILLKNGKNWKQTYPSIRY